MNLGLLSKKAASDQSSIQPSAFKQMVEDMPVSVMTCDLTDFTITYANRSSLEALRTIEHVLPVKADQIVGQSIDIFHKNPEHQRRLLADPSNLPFKAKITIGGEWLDLLVTAIHDNSGRYLGPMLTWSIVTEQLKQEAEAEKLMQMIDVMPINVMMANKDTLEIEYINKTSQKTLAQLQSLLPCPVTELQGKCIDIFHKNPDHQRRLLGDPSNLPHRAVISLGDEKLELNVAAIRDKQGEYIGPMVSWSIVTDQIKMANSVGSVVTAVSSAATEMQASATAMNGNAEQANNKASTVASASEELSSSIGEISRQVSHAAEVAQNALDDAQKSSEMINGLAQASEQIGAVVSLIQDIAEQTNLLALNATIEAARAGEAGKGFAVVASEVKALANQTAKATEEIAQKISEIQNSTGAAVTANETITNRIGEINQATTAIASAIEEQGAATQEVTVNIGSVSESSSETGRIASDIMEASSELAKQADDLEQNVKQFLEAVGAA
ncbi:MAG: methyl-accepting chemotaxis protein [Kiloniellales bacterium]|nr:methyl-accepting chemotaxis protein [Kiloniellales bacterium]